MKLLLSSSVFILQLLSQSYETEMSVKDKIIIIDYQIIIFNLYFFYYYRYFVILFSIFLYI